MIAGVDERKGHGPVLESVVEHLNGEGQTKPGQKSHHQPAGWAAGAGERIQRSETTAITMPP